MLDKLKKYRKDKEFETLKNWVKNMSVEEYEIVSHGFKELNEMSPALFSSHEKFFKNFNNLLSSIEYEMKYCDIPSPKKEISKTNKLVSHLFKLRKINFLSDLDRDNKPVKFNIKNLSWFIPTFEKNQMFISCTTDENDDYIFTVKNGTNPLDNEYKSYVLKSKSNDFVQSGGTHDNPTIEKTTCNLLTKTFNKSFTDELFRFGRTHKKDRLALLETLLNGKQSQKENIDEKTK